MSIMGVESEGKKECAPFFTRWAFPIGCAAMGEPRVVWRGAAGRRNGDQKSMARAELSWAGLGWAECGQEEHVGSKACMLCVCECGH